MKRVSTGPIWAVSNVENETFVWKILCELLRPSKCPRCPFANSQIEKLEGAKMVDRGRTQRDMRDVLLTGDFE